MQILVMKRGTQLCIQTLHGLHAHRRPIPLLWKCRFCFQCYSKGHSAVASLQHDDRIPKRRRLQKLSISLIRDFQSRRQLTTVSDGMMRSQDIGAQEYLLTSAIANHDSWGPLDEYDERVHARQLRDDEHQRGTHSLSWACTSDVLTSCN